MNEIKSLNNKIVDILVENNIEQEIAFTTLMTICLNIVVFQEISKDDFILFCNNLYDEIETKKQEIVH
jgi:hypothetical protein